MKRFHQKLLRALYILTMIALLCLPALAAEDAEDTDYLRVTPSEDTDYYFDHTVESSRRGAANVPTYTTGDQAIEIIKRYEGFAPMAMWDYQRYSIGYGSSYEKACQMFPSVAATGYITEEQATELLKDDLKSNESVLNSFLRNNAITVNQNQFDALADFTYSVGTGWTTYKNSDGTWCLLKQMLLDSPSTWTLSRAKESFGTWVYAGGVVLPGLVTRRNEEAELFMTPLGGSSGFADVYDGLWYSSYVKRASDLGLMNGHSDGTFGPEEAMSRAQTAQALANFNSANLSSFQNRPSVFQDVGDAWYRGAVNWAYGAGLINGRGSGLFDPEGDISRQHLCSILARYLRSQGILPTTSVGQFLDDGLIEQNSKADVYYCASLGLVNGVGDGRFDPTGAATRAQVVTILVRMYELVYGA